jgi:hypothetical protein
MSKFKSYYRAKYNFWRWLATLGHTIFRFGQWRSFSAYDKMGGRRRKTTRPVKIVLDFVRGILYNIYVAIRVAIKKLK